MPRISAREIREAIRQLPEAERQQLIDDLLDDELTESDADVVALEAALDRADREEFIEDKDLDAYMEARRKERKRVRGEH